MWQFLDSAEIQARYLERQLGNSAVTLDSRSNRHLVFKDSLSATCVCSRAGDASKRGSSQARDRSGTKWYTDQPLLSFSGEILWLEGLGRKVVDWGSQASGESFALCWGSLLLPVYQGLGSHWHLLPVLQSPDHSRQAAHDYGIHL